MSNLSEQIGAVDDADAQIDAWVAAGRGSTVVTEYAKLGDIESALIRGNNALRTYHRLASAWHQAAADEWQVSNETALNVWNTRHAAAVAEFVRLTHVLEQLAKTKPASTRREAEGLPYVRAALLTGWAHATRRTTVRCVRPLAHRRRLPARRHHGHRARRRPAGRGSSGDDPPGDHRHEVDPPPPSAHDGGRS